MVVFLRRVWEGFLSFFRGVFTRLGLITPSPQMPGEEPTEDEVPSESPPKESPDEPDPTEPEDDEPPKSEPEDPTEGPLPVVSGRGIWIWRMVMAEDGNVARIIERAKRAGVEWITIKGGNGSSWWSQLTKTVVQEIQQAGIKVLGWVYAYGNNPEVEASVAVHVLDLGCDGLIIDAEQEFEGKPGVAQNYMSFIRASYPDAFIAYTTFPIISLHPTFPYIEFGKYCDAAMPQCYWRLIGLGPREMIRRTKDEWNNWANDLKKSGYGDSIKPIVPVGQGFGVSPSEVQEFMEAAENFPGVSLWNWTEMTDSIWRVFSGGTVENTMNESKEETVVKEESTIIEGPVPIVEEQTLSEVENGDLINGEGRQIEESLEKIEEVCIDDVAQAKNSIEYGDLPPTNEVLTEEYKTEEEKK